ncbi:MAG TPA: metallopeptidase family protein [Candidatus Paceibacterota bacterium]
MNRAQFEAVVRDEFPRAVPEKFRSLVKNVAFLVEEEPDEETRKLEGLEGEDTLLGLYRGVPLAERGSDYGIGELALPDTVTLYRLPILDEAEDLGGGEDAVRRVVRETIWHEVAHHFGLDEREVEAREDELGHGR